MTEPLEVDLYGVIMAADACRSTGDDARVALNQLLDGLTREAIEAAAGNDDYGRQISEGWAGGLAPRFPEFAEAIESQLTGRGDQMTICGRVVARTDGDAARQVRAADIGLERTAEGWSVPPDEA